MNTDGVVLVTGGCGYVGSRLVPRLLDLGMRVRVLDTQWFGNYLGNLEGLEVLVGDVRYIDNDCFKDVRKVIHLANIANDPGVELNPSLSWEVNVLATQLLIEKSIKHGISQFVYASSGSVYGIKSEDQVTEDLELVPISVYNKTKMVAERVLLSYAPLLPVHIIRPATVCGFSPRMRLDVSVNMLTMQAFKNGTVTVFGGDQTRPNIHIEDMCRVYEHFLDNDGLPSGPYNAGFENISILEIAHKVRQHVDCKISVSESNDLRSYRQDSQKLLNTGFAPKFTVDDAIEQMVSMWKSGELVDEDSWYTVKTMKKLGL
jgi:nucleoside-diphosphate-sugar epimerase